jgi:hypothetical protein
VGDAAWLGFTGWVGDAAWVGLAGWVGLAEPCGFAEWLALPFGDGVAEVSGRPGTAVGSVLGPAVGSSLDPGLGLGSGVVGWGCLGCSRRGLSGQPGGSTQPAAYETPIPPKTTTVASPAAGAMTRKRLRDGAGRGAVRATAASLPTSSSSASGSSTEARSALRTSERDERRFTG